MALDRITVDPNRMRGQPCIRDTRVTVSAVLGQLAAGARADDVLADYPYLERDDVLAVLEYAATDEEAMLVEGEASFERLAADPEARAAYRAESRELEAGF